MESILPYLRKRKYLATLIVTLIYLIIVFTLVLVPEEPADVDTWLPIVAGYFVWIGLFFSKDQPEEEKVELYLLPGNIHEAMIRIRAQEFCLKKDSKNTKLFTRKISYFRTARIRLRYQNEGYWIINGRRKFLESSEELRMQWA